MTQPAATDHAVLDNATHGELRVATGAAVQFGDGIMACPVMPNEFRQVQAHYPILFRLDAEGQAFTAHALFGFDTGENLFLNDGEWDARYRPLAMAVQPFLIGRSRDGGDAQVHIDMAHPRVGHADGVRLFDEDGRPTPFLEEMSQLLGTLDQGYRASGAFFDALRRYDLLEPFSLEIPLDDGSKNRLVGFHIIDEDRLRALDPAALGDLHAADHLLPIFMALGSLAQIGGLVDRKNRTLRYG
ncbi:SapC family protein [uncultured Croceicoccus sp.]|uniref:SapC family protein n=1 Tax=uncultured Croceicoccus sp. TaxID=1295329 RepID=UPI00260F0318|nr:SapC family protein [uncultured Croceicoccus sp.]